MDNNDMGAVLTTAELATRWRKSVATVNAMRANATGPKFVRLGTRSFLYRLADVIEFENARMYGSTAEAERAAKDRRAADEGRAA
ncbi:DNA-binding protein [Rhodoblastus sp.]|jgi:hypothetical protein|uniref:helix-turn-helix transcriptional regulator n=1 Tax=Rhodoblastus sp. TaxID=1962975 RepID=UPI0025D25578|nr:DNA-binding protein [Rhodoblastus sp.]